MRRKLARKPSPSSSEPSLRDKLSASFIESVQKDWDENRATAIAELREKDIKAYAELVAKLISPEHSVPSSPWAAAKSSRDIGKLLLAQVGMDPDMVTDEMAYEAVAANLRLIEQLEAIKERDLNSGYEH